MYAELNLAQLLLLLDKHDFKELHVHHTWRPEKKDYDGSNAVALQNGMKNYHVNTKGWSDIGQHITIFPDGKILTGRNFTWNPASILGHNSKAFMLEMIGNFDVGHDVLEGAQLDVLLGLITYFTDKGKYTRFHNENSTKTCPGSSIVKTHIMGLVATAKKPSAGVGDGHVTVRQIQELCNEYGYKDKWGHALKLDGIWGVKTASAVPLIKKGSNLKYFVYLIQKILLYKGYKLPIYGADKFFGKETLAAILAFQKKNYLVPDGIVGPLTWAELLK
ncbi:peptidoglycan recognition protein family protein [Clostridium sp. DL1XJH146]